MTRTTAALLTGTALCLLGTRRASHNQLSLPSFPGVCEIECSLPGRLRLRLPALCTDTALGENCRSQLLRAEAVQNCTVNARLGTMLILFDPAQVDGAVIEGAVLRLMGLEQALEEHPEAKVRKGMKRLVQAIDHAVYEKTNGLLDAKTLAAVGLSGAAIRSCALGGLSLPGAATLLWWASSLWGRNDP